MKPDEIINGLNAVKEVYQPKNAQAIDAAIQAVQLLEEAKKALEGTCTACKWGETLGKCPACQECIEAHRGINWEFRWPLGKDAAT